MLSVDDFEVVIEDMHPKIEFAVITEETQEEEDEDPTVSFSVAQQNATQEHRPLLHRKADEDFIVESHDCHLGAQIMRTSTSRSVTATASVAASRSICKTTSSVTASRTMPMKATQSTKEKPIVFKLPAGSIADTTLDIGLEVLQSQRNFREKGALRWPDQLEGNFLTYGWVLLVNTFSRQFFLLYSVVMTTKYPVFGTCSQSIIFMFNFAMILNLKPYASELLSSQEALLIGCMAMLTWGGAFRELLIQHNQAKDHPRIVADVGRCMDVLVVLILIVVVSTVFYNMKLMLGAITSKEKPADALNRYHFERVLAAEKARVGQQMARLRKVHEEEDPERFGQSSIFKDIKAQSDFLQERAGFSAEERRQMDIAIMKVLVPHMPALRPQLRELLRSSPTAVAERRLSATRERSLHMQAYSSESTLLKLSGRSNRELDDIYDDLEEDPLTAASAPTGAELTASIDFTSRWSRQLSPVEEDADWTATR